MLVGDSWYEYFAIRTAIATLRLITPLSVVYCVSAPIIQPDVFRTLPLAPISIWAALETSFFCVYVVLREHSQREASHPVPPSKAQRSLLFDRCLATVNDHVSYLRGWFLGSSLDNIGHDDCLEFYAWSFLNKPFSKVTNSELEELESYVARLEEQADLKLSPGRRGVASLRGTFDPVLITHRPLIWYLIIGVVDTFTSLRLWSAGLRFHSHRWSSTFQQLPFRPLSIFGQRSSPESKVSYWCRRHTSKRALPVVFVHGIGVGLYTYTSFLQDLVRHVDPEDDGDIGVLAVEILSISARICPSALAPMEMKAEIMAIVDEQGWDEFALVGHSYGTGICATILRDFRFSPRVNSVVLLDPICFLLHLPDVAFNFTRRLPKSASEHMLYYFSSQDLRISHTIGRRFFWSELIMWKEDLRRDLPMTVALSAKDIIVPVTQVRDYLTSDMNNNAMASKDTDVVQWKDGRLNVVWFNYLNHAGLFASAGYRRAMSKQVLEYSRKRVDT